MQEGDVERFLIVLGDSELLHVSDPDPRRSL
jgi:hypothetical protein